jgi:arsenate reductase
MLAASLLLGLAFSADAQRSSKVTTSTERTPTVLFMCPHGAAKSVLASAYFRRLAKERGLNVQVDAAGTESQDAVSPVVAEHLRRNGYPIPVTKPRAVTKEDLDRADIVISMGGDLTALPATPQGLQKWDDVPGPSEDLAGADEAIRRRGIALVEELLARQRK